MHQPITTSVQQTMVEHKEHFVTLDGLRGVAAFAVMMFHDALMLGNNNLLPQAPLAVDFFFALSGFVIAYAYERKLNTTMSFSEYAARRAARLYPMLVAGAVLGSLFWIIEGRHYGTGSGTVLVLMVVASLAMPAWRVPRFGFSHYPINPPSWSLTFEIAANLLYGAIVRFLSWPVLLAIVVTSWLLLGIAGYHADYLESGNPGEQFWSNIPRTTFSFFAGVALCRGRGRLPKLSVPTMILAIVLVLCFLPSQNTFTWLYKFACISILFPLIIINAVHRKPSGIEAHLLSISGELSYPVYILHWPVFTWLQLIASHVGLPLHGAKGTLIGACVTIVTAAALLYGYDRPTRQYLNRWIERHFSNY